MLPRRALVRAAGFLAAAPLVLLWPSVAAAQQPADEATINATIKRGVEYLKSKQKASGYWGTGEGAEADAGHRIGYTSLVGLTLVECGVPTSDIRLRAAANLVRSKSHELDDTYDLTLAILFLDRMKDKVDERVIRLLAGRLISAQMPSGGWGYKTHKYPEKDVIALVTALRKLSKPEPGKEPPAVDKLKQTVPQNMRNLAVWDETTGRLPADPPKEKRSDLFDATTDNSNTHFAMVGLWAARKYDIPVDRTFALVARRFRTSQGPGGTWTYDFARTGADGGNQFTCIALLAVAIGHVVSPPGVKPEADPVIIKAFTALSKSVGTPAGDINNRPKVKDVGGLYFMWAMERIAVLYDVRKLGDKDWYLWGAEILCGNQAANGSWDQEGGYPGQTPLCNTCLALLFLRRANLTPDLSQLLLVNTGTLISKVDAPPPKKEEPPPSPKVEAPPPTPKVEEPPPTPKKEEPKVVAAPVPAPAPAPEPEPVKKKSPLIWIILGALVAAVVGGFLAFLLVKNRNKDDEEKPTKKKKPKVEAAAEKPAKSSTTTKKLKQDVEVDDD